MTPIDHPETRFIQTGEVEEVDCTMTTTHDRNDPRHWVNWKASDRQPPESLAVKQMRIEHGRRITLVLFAVLCFVAFPCCWLVFMLLDGPEFQWLFGG